jgi:hypothetical protein
MKLSHHIASSALVAGLLYFFLKSWSMALSCFLSGIFIDLDHVYDYVREVGFPFKMKDFIRAGYESELSRWMIFLHSWELLVLLGMIAWFTQWNPWVTGVCIGFSHHIILDMLYNREGFLTYSFYWRWKHNFEFELTFPHVARKKRKRNESRQTSL